MKTELEKEIKKLKEYLFLCEISGNASINELDMESPYPHTLEERKQLLLKDINDYLEATQKFLDQEEKTY